MAATYDTKKVSVIVGTHIVKGGADGTFVIVERNTDTYTRKTGAGGETARLKSNDKSGRITINLMQTSESNDFFSGLAAADEATNGGKVPILVIENGGSTIAEAPEAWLIKIARIEYGKDLVDRSWVFETGELFETVGSLPA